MKQIKYLPIYVLLVTLGMIAFIAFLVHFAPVTVLNPAGGVAKDERNLMIVVVILMSLLAIPSVFLTYYFAWKYRADNPKHPSFAPEHTANKKMILVWWSIPIAAALVLSCIIWPAAHALAPRASISSSVKPLTVQVVALQWKWLFIYPEQHIATVNFLEIPTHRPIHFYLTADAPMTSFWIPNIGGQIYAMNGMQNQINFIIDQVGDSEGKNAEINGDGYAEMDFLVRAATQQNFDNWVTKVKKGHMAMDQKVFDTVTKPSEDYPQTTYASVDPNLYTSILMMYMTPPTKEMQMNKNSDSMGSMKGMDMSTMDMSK